MSDVKCRSNNPGHRTRLGCRSPFSSGQSDCTGQMVSSGDEELPDGFCISPKRISKTCYFPEEGCASMDVQYVGSFAVVGESQDDKTEFVRSKLLEMKNLDKCKPVLLAISLSGIKVCCDSGESVYMAHALRRISYATCNPSLCQFSFLAREPKAQSNNQFCHTFLTKSPQEAEELNMIIANAFRIAYAHQRTSPQSVYQPSFQALIQHQMCLERQLLDEQSRRDEEALAGRLSQISTSMIDKRVQNLKEQRQKKQEEHLQHALRNKERTVWAKQAAENVQHRRPLVDGMLSPATSVNSIENTSRDSPAKEIFQDKCTEADTPAEAQYLCPVKCCSDDHDSSNICCRHESPSSSQSRPVSGKYQNEDLSQKSIQDGGRNLNSDEQFQSPATPIRHDSLRKAVALAEEPIEEPEDLPWYQPCLSREHVLEILSQQEIGSFLIRDSTTHPGCYALSVKVPKYDNPTGISHYLVMRTERGSFRLKGLDKEWSTLTSLVTHHTVMRELLPCLLNLPRDCSASQTLENVNG